MKNKNWFDDLKETLVLPKIKETNSIVFEKNIINEQRFLEFINQFISQKLENEKGDDKKEIDMKKVGMLK